MNSADKMKEVSEVLKHNAAINLIYILEDAANYLKDNLNSLDTNSINLIQKRIEKACTICSIANEDNYKINNNQQPVQVM